MNQEGFYALNILQTLYNRGKLQRIDPNYKVLSIIGCKGSNNIYLVCDATQSMFEMKLCRFYEMNCLIECERSMLMRLSTSKYVPRLISYGYYKERAYNITKQLGYSLKNLYYKKLHQFSVAEAKLICLLCFKALKSVHECGVVHGNLKASNILTGQYYPVKKIKLMGFERAFEINQENNQPLDQSLQINSENQHQRPTFSDDLKKLLDVIVFVYTGTLPWDYVFNSDRLLRTILVSGEETNYLSLLCKDIPECSVIKKMLEYQRNLQYDEIPNYKYLMKLCKQLPYVEQHCDSSDDFATRHYTSALNSTIKLKDFPKINPKVKNLARKYKNDSQLIVLDVKDA